MTEAMWYYRRSKSEIQSLESEMTREIEEVVVVLLLEVYIHMYNIR